MIIYGLISNNGGMLRVAQSLEKVFKALPDDFPLRVFIFSDKKPFEFPTDKFVWFKIDDMENSHLEASVLRLRTEIKDYIGNKKVDWIIADFLTLDLFREIEARICYDVHFLGRPFFETLSRYDKMNIIDEISGKSFYFSLHLQHLSFVRFEARLMKRATRFIVNSQASLKCLRNSYIDVCDSKMIDYIPVSSELQGQELVTSETRPGLYFHGRFHPQKGLHFLINEQWHDLPLTIRGIEPSYLTPETLEIFKQQGIQALPWTSDSSIIKAEILSHEFIVFPSIYEPWGLALQEALSLGKICIAHFSESGHEEQIVDEVNGFLIDYSQPDFKQRIKEIMTLPEATKNSIRLNAKKMSTLGHADRILKLRDFLLKLRDE